MNLMLQAIVIFQFTFSTPLKPKKATLLILEGIRITVIDLYSGYYS